MSFYQFRNFSAVIGIEKIYRASNQRQYPSQNKTSEFQCRDEQPGRNDAQDRYPGKKHGLKWA
ncbi:MAG: hypothetical protein OEU55_16455, partial [Desulfobacterales bacterium]|nr:hypothetical protein [Desulfobacterales bacterium]